MKNLVIALLFTVHVSYAAFERWNSGADVLAMGGASVAVPGSGWAMFSNPALLQLADSRLLSLAYTPQPFGMKELARGSLAFIQPTEMGAFGVSAVRFGFELYREITLSASYAHTLADRFHLGVTFNYHTLTIQNYGSDAAFAFDVGFLTEIVENVQWGFSALNVNAARISQEKERLPQLYATGISYQPASDITLAADIVKDIRFPAELRIGVGYQLHEYVQLRAGSATEPATLNAGLGIRYSLLQLDYAITNHHDLGMTHQFSLTLNLGE
ncbi:MAG: hypothetical protein ACKVRP_07470 [Bacteroidota bacterium]